MCSDTVNALEGLGIEKSIAISIIDQLTHKNQVEVVVLKDDLREDVLAGNGRFMNFSVKLDGEANQSGYINLIIKRLAS